MAVASASSQAWAKSGSSWRTSLARRRLKPAIRAEAPTLAVWVRASMKAALRAAEIFHTFGDAAEPSLGLSPAGLAGFAEKILADPPISPAADGAPPEVVFRLALTLA